MGIYKKVSRAWIYDRRSNGLCVSRKLIMAKVKYFYKISCIIMVFHYIIKITNAKQDLEQLIDKLILYILHAPKLSIKYKYPPPSSIIVWMKYRSWVACCLTQQSIGKEQNLFVWRQLGMKNVLSVYACLAAKGDKNKLKLFPVFRTAKKEFNSWRIQILLCC